MSDATYWPKMQLMKTEFPLNLNQLRKVYIGTQLNGEPLKTLNLGTEGKTISAKKMLGMQPSRIISN